MFLTNIDTCLEKVDFNGDFQAYASQTFEQYIKQIKHRK